MKHIISLGWNCTIKINYNKWCKIRNKNCGKTNFFDYLIISINGINNFFENNINDILNNIIDDGIINKKKKIKFKLLDNATSIHDLPINYSKLYYQKFLDKYRRRYNRLYELIKNNNEKIFIRYGSITKDDYEKLNNNIYKINSSCNFKIISISDDTNKYSIKVNDWDEFFDKLNII